MVNIKISKFQEDLNRLNRELRNLESEIPFAMAYTLTQMGQAGKAAVTKGLPHWFDRPTRWTMGAILLKAATKTNQQAVVWIKDGSINSLAHHIEGVKRPPKGFEKQLRQKGILRGSNQYAVPGYGAKLDRYGNMSRGQINKILSAVGAQMDPYANTTKNSIKRNSGQGDYFVLKRQAGGKVLSGIYQRVGPKNSPDLKSILIFVEKTSYRRRFPFFEEAEDAAYDAMPAAVDKAIDNAFRSAFKLKK